MIQREFERLAAELDAMASTRDAAEEMLEELATALFPSGDVALERLTWSDDKNGEATTESAEARLKAAEARFRTLVEQIPAVTFMAVLGQGKNEVYVSPHIEQMLGFTQAEWLSDPFLWYWQLHPDDRKLWNDEFARGCRSGGPFRAECRFIARDGHVVWVHGEARVVRDDLGRPTFLQGVAFDITESKRAQEVLVTEAVRGAKIEEELAIARRVQTSILPRNLTVDGLEIAVAMVPADDVGGDYYDVLPFKGGAWIGIGDVSGHGLNAGLIMLMVQSATASIALSRPRATPREVLLLLNDILCENVRIRLGGDDHVTFTLFRYTSDGRLLFAGAHEDILVWRAATGQVECVRPPGTWIGARRDIARVTVDALLELQDRDLVVLYTDGITEAMSASGEQFELERLSRLVETMADKPVAAIRDGIMSTVRAWTPIQHDDMSVVVLRYRAPTVAG